MATEKKDSYCAIHGSHPLEKDPCFACIEDFKDANRKPNQLDRASLVEASYRIASDIFKKVPKTRTVGFIRGYQKAGTVAHDVLKKMIEEAK